MRTKPARRRVRRAGYSLLEVLAVMAMLVILGGVLMPTFGGMARDTRTKAAGDMVREHVAQARAHAMQSGVAYRLAVSSDGRRVRVAPDDPDAGAGDDLEPPYFAEGEFPKPVNAAPQADGADLAVDDGEWLRVATFLPDGTCREDSPTLELREPDCYPLIVRVRGLTGAASLTPGPPSKGR